MTIHCFSTALLCFLVFFTVRVNYSSFCSWLFYVTIRNKIQFPSSISFHTNQMQYVFFCIWLSNNFLWNWCGDNYTVLLDKWLKNKIILQFFFSVYWLFWYKLVWVFSHGTKTVDLQTHQTFWLVTRRGF